MAEAGPIAAIIEGGEETEEKSATSGLDPMAVAVAMDVAGADPGLVAKLGAYFDKQSHFVDVQTEHLHEQRELILSHMRLRRYNERIRSGVSSLLVIVVAVLASGLVYMVYAAAASHSVVVSAFKTPTALASRGLTGEVVAASIMDGLRQLQAATRASSEGLKVTSTWASEIKIEVPETGISIGEILRLLHERFGHDLHIDGELIQTKSGGLVLTVRGDDIPAKSFATESDDPDKLAIEAAEYVYGRTQPLRYVTYLENAGRNDDALALLPGEFARAANDDERAKWANAWGNVLSEMMNNDQALEKYRLALSLKPDDWKIWNNLVAAVPFADGEEAGWQESRRFLQAADKAAPKDKPKKVYFNNVAQNLWDVPLWLSSSLAGADLNGGTGAGSGIAGPVLAEVYTLMHNPAKAAQYLAGSDPHKSETKAERFLLEAYAAFERGHAADAVRPMENFWKAWQTDPHVQSAYYDNQCFLGLAYGLSGHLKDAEVIFTKAGQWSRCAAFHGDVLEEVGDLAGARRVWDEGLRVAPDLPHVYLHRGMSEHRLGDLKEADADLAKANAKAPHWADPLKAWGDLFATQERWGEALAKYEEALKYAPDWGALKEARETAIKHRR